jgi:beta-glucosidase
MTHIDFVERLLTRMTLAQKIGQMTQTERMVVTPQQVKEFHLGSVLSGGGSAPAGNRPQDWVEMNDAYWVASMEADDEHMAIPLIYGVDAIHGNNNVLGATVFPHNIGLGAMNDPDMIQRIAEVTAREVLAAGVEWTFAPTLAVAKNLQWGRTYESYSSDPALVSRYSGRFVQGLQGELGEHSVVACVKHWVGDGGTTYGIDQGDTAIDWQVLSDEHIAPYLPALKAGSLTVMVSFNSWNGDKCHGHRYLLTDVLKQRLGFDGFIISDWDGIDYLDDDYLKAVELAVNAGIDMFMIADKWQAFIANLHTLVSTGRVLESRIDDAVRRILSVKFRYGLFDRPRPSERPFSNDALFGSVEHRLVARQAVAQTQVLLKNDAQILPLSKQARILVAGRFSHDTGALAGGFTVAWQGQTGPAVLLGATSVWSAVKASAPNAFLSAQRDGIEADSAAHDVAIVVIGEHPYAEGMGDIRPDDNQVVESGSHIKGSLKVLAPYGRSLELTILHPEDLQAIQNITARGVPVVVVLISGRPLLVDPEMAASQAFVAAWLPGSEGAGITDVLFGDKAFTGRLSFAWPSLAGPGFERGYGLNSGGV